MMPIIEIIYFSVSFISAVAILAVEKLPSNLIMALWAINGIVFFLCQIIIIIMSDIDTLVRKLKGKGARIISIKDIDLVIDAISAERICVSANQIKYIKAARRQYRYGFCPIAILFLIFWLK